MKEEREESSREKEAGEAFLPLSPFLSIGPSSRKCRLPGKERRGAPRACVRGREERQVSRAGTGRE